MDEVMAEEAGVFDGPTHLPRFFYSLNILYVLLPYAIHLPELSVTSLDPYSLSIPSSLSFACFGYFSMSLKKMIFPRYFFGETGSKRDVRCGSVGQA